jgi:PqqA peptide cyclase
MTSLVPIGLLAELSHRCPLRCPYCSNPQELVRKSRELDTASWQRVFGEAAELGVLHVHLSGGEPTVRTDLEVLVETAAREGLYTNLITSGVLLDVKRIEALTQAGLDHIQLSIQAASATLADRIGGYDGGHAAKRSVAQWVVDAGLPLTVNVVVHRQNLHELDQIIDLALELGAGRLEVAHTQYLGWAYRNREALLPSRDELDRATALVEARREALRGVMTIDYVVPDYHGVRPKACMGGWGRQFIVVTPDGRVLPCHGADSIASLVFENVEVRSLADIWRTSEAFERFRGTSWMPEPCRSCPKKEEDWGGCRCQAFALTGDAAQADPVCELSPAHGIVETLVIGTNTADPASMTAFEYRSWKG